uniref:Uncharacterized protein n=2 Tax=Bradyrhizobium septentrionale TaxID=1404411 RepID=A0A973WA32_9BRAD
MTILAKKGIGRARAGRAIKETLDLAASVHLEKLRRDMARGRIDVGKRAAEGLCRRLDSFVGEVDRLPPSSKHLLNKSVERPLACGFFDTSTFFSVLDAMAATLPRLSPKVRADAAYAVLFARDADREPSAGLGWVREEGSMGPVSRDTCTLLWEELDAETRRKCEMTIEGKLPKDISLFRILADTLRIPAHSFMRGAPPSLYRDYARSVDRIWDKLGISKGRRRYDPDPTKSQLSAFAKFANEALAAVGIESHVSDRQIRQALGQRKKQRHQ